MDSHSEVISCILMYLFFTYTHKRNNATLTYFLKLMSILKNSYTPKAKCTLAHGPLRLSCVLLALSLNSEKDTIVDTKLTQQ